MPKLSMTMEQGTILQWFKQEGDEVKEGDLLLEVMSDKINIEVESYVSGTLLKVYFGPDEVVPVNQIIGYIGSPGEQVPDVPPPVDGRGGAAEDGDSSMTEEAAQRGLRRTAEEQTEESTVEVPQGGKVRATPAARKLAREHQVDLRLVIGSGPGGRIHRADVEAYVAQVNGSGGDQTKATPLARKVAAAKGVDLTEVSGSGANGKIRKQDVLAVAERSVTATAAEKGQLKRLKLEGIRKIVAQRMVESAFTAPHVTLTTDVDMSAAVEMRKELLPVVEQKTGHRLSYTEIIVKAVAHALAAHPAVNASLEQDEIVLHDRVNIGLAVSIPNGLVVPVVRDADRKGLAQLVADCKDLAARARANKLLPDDIKGGTFTISNLGMYAIDAFTPIINPPESAILGVGRIQEKPVGLDGSIVLRPMMTLSLSFDHRVIDGAPAAAFLTDVKDLLEKPYQLLV